MNTLCNMLCMNDNAFYNKNHQTIIYFVIYYIYLYIYL